MAIERLFVGEGIKEAEVKQFLNKELKRAGLAGIVIQRTPLVTRIVIYCDRPAIVIGRKGRNVKQITRRVEEDFGIERPELEIKKVDNPNLEPDIVAYRISSALERGMNPRKVGYRALQSIIGSGAKGAEIMLSGKLVGKGGRARTLKMKAGYMKKCGHPSFTQVLSGYMVASCKPGNIGVSVRIVPPKVHFPDEINIVKEEDFEIEETEGAAKPEGKPEGKPEAKKEASKEAPKADKKEVPKTGAKTEKPAEVKKEEKPKEEKKPEAPKEEAKPAEKAKEEIKPEKPKAEAKPDVKEKKTEVKEETKAEKKAAEKPGSKK